MLVRFCLKFLVESVVSSVVVIASEDVWVGSQFSLDFLSDDMLVAVEADSASWWTWSTSWTHFTIWTWWTLSAWNTRDTSWTVWTFWTGGTIWTFSTGITNQTWFTSGTWLTWSANWTAVTWPSVQAWVTWSTLWTWVTSFTGWASLTWGTSGTWLTIFTWVTVSSIWTWNTSSTWSTNWTASGSVWTWGTWWTSWTLGTWSTSWTLSTVWSNIGGGETVFTVLTGLTWGTWLTVHTGSTVNTLETLSAWNTGLTWDTWWTHWTHWTFLLFTFTFAFSGSALNLWGLSWASVVNFRNTISVSVWLVSGADSISGGDVSLQEVEVWAARQTSFLFGTFGSNGVNHNVDFSLSEVEGGFLDLSQGFLFDNTGVSHDHQNSSGVFGFRTEVVEHFEGGVKTFGDVVTMAHVLSVLDGTEEASFLGGIFEGGDDFGFGGVSNNTDFDVVVVFVVEFFDHGGGGSFHSSPVFFDTGGRVQKNNDFDWAWYFWDGGDIIATSASTFSQIHTGGRSDRSDFVFDILLGGDSQKAADGS